MLASKGPHQPSPWSPFFWTNHQPKTNQPLTNHQAKPTKTLPQRPPSKDVKAKLKSQKRPTFSSRPDTFFNKSSERSNWPHMGGANPWQTQRWASGRCQKIRNNIYEFPNLNAWQELALLSMMKPWKNESPAVPPLGFVLHEGLLLSP